MTTAAFQTHTYSPKPLPTSAADPAATPAEPLLTDAAGVAAMLDLDAATVRRMDAAGKLPAPIRLNARVVRWRPDEIRAWVAAGCPARKVWQATQKAARR